MKILVSSFIFTSLLLLACQTQDSAPKGNYGNPNGNSELALLMREMLDDSEAIKADILKGDRPEAIRRFVEIHTAKATEPEKANSQEYKMYSDAYLNALNMLEQASDDEFQDSYHAMVNSCMNCHRELCPGPMVIIKKLYIAESK